MLLSSTCSLRKLRNLCSRLNKRLSQSHGTITEKNLHISQLEDAVKHLGAKVETTTEEAEKKSKDVAELHLKLNENYRLVAELSSDNLRYVPEKNETRVDFEFFSSTKKNIRLGFYFLLITSASRF